MFLSSDNKLQAQVQYSLPSLTCWFLTEMIDVNIEYLDSGSFWYISIFGHLSDLVMALPVIHYEILK